MKYLGFKTITLFVLLTVSVPIVAQNAPETSDLSDVSSKEEALMNAVLREDLFIINISRLALERSQSSEVKGLARTLVSAHTQMSSALMALARDSGLVLTGNRLSELTPERRQALEQLVEVEGPAFDTRYLAQQARVHNAAVGALEQLPELVSNPAMKFFVNAASPIMKSHLEMAQDLAR